MKFNLFKNPSSSLRKLLENNKKDYLLSENLLEGYTPLIANFKEPSALNEFIKRLQDLEEVEFYFQSNTGKL